MSDSGAEPSDTDVRLGRVLTGLAAGASAIREAVKYHGPAGPIRQSLDEEEHEGFWLTRRQVKAAIDAASNVEAILRDLYVRMDPRCKASLGERPSWMSPAQYDPCRCTLPRGHDGDHQCTHTAGGPICHRTRHPPTPPSGRSSTVLPLTVTAGPAAPP